MSPFAHVEASFPLRASRDDLRMIGRFARRGRRPHFLHRGSGTRIEIGHQRLGFAFQVASASLMLRVLLRSRIPRFVLPRRRFRQLPLQALY